jgi:serine/threonine protein kinase
VPPRREALQIALAIAQVLEAAHRINLVHRDIKPENIVRRSHRRTAPRSASSISAWRSSPTPLSSIGRMTEEGILGGTPAYMSPEQARGKAVGPPSDVYSLGCTLYELIAGRPPFLGAVAELLTRHAYAPPLTLRELELEPPIEPAHRSSWCGAMLGKSPPLRPTATAVAQRP